MEYRDFMTKALHAGYDSSRHGNATSVPVYGTASFNFNTAETMADAFGGRRPGHIYSRLSNPTVGVFEARMAALEKGIGAVALASGMAAISAALFALLKQGDELAVGSSLFGGSLHFFNDVLRRYGITTKYFDASDTDQIKTAIGEKTKLVFVESLGNPALDIPDFEALSFQCKSRTIPLIVDNTLPSPVLFNPGDIGAALTIHSTTKSITGNGSAVGGVFIDTGCFDWSAYADDALVETISKYGAQFGFLAHARQTIFSNTGGCMAPHNAYLHLLGIETLQLRTDRHCANALELATHLETHPAVSGVNYPGLEDSPYRERAVRHFGGRGGGLLTLRLADKDKCFSFINSLNMAKQAANLGDSRTLVIHPASTIYATCTDKERRNAGVTDDLVRVSVGLEGIADIIDDFDSALQ
ncbi:MAG: O-acetylhomoserine aminocarboxypropyltransferase/cysteine synthase [Spirochaetales bacterium]|jgi:O-acetylhomoserine (thiol)-lyase|nr:O-acetylhomoserine aminocarboxypropyltransferase/cysteine synthase [Spirochaetales bacterium]